MDSETDGARPTSPMPVTPRRQGGTWINLLLGAAALIAVAGVAFAIGRSTAPAAVAGVGTIPGRGNLPGGGAIIDPGASFDPGAAPGGGLGGPGAGGPGFFGSGGLSIDGEITSVDGSTLTVKLASGESTTFTVDDSTTYHEASSTDAHSVKVGDDVSIRMTARGIGGGAGTGGGTPSLTAGDVTVQR